MITLLAFNLQLTLLYFLLLKLWFHVILGSNFVLLCFKLVIIHYHTKNKEKLSLNQRKMQMVHTIIGVRNTNTCSIKY